MTDPREKKTLAVTNLRKMIQNQKPAFQMALGKPELAEQFVRSALTLVNMNKKLGECDPMSFLGALMQTAQLKLDLTLGQAWLIPFWNSKKGCNIAQFQIGYQGYIDLFYRHQMASELYVEIVYKNDVFEYTLGTDRKIVHKPAIGERGEMIAVYAVAKLTSGATALFVMSVPELQKYKTHYSKPDREGRYGVWDSNFEAMAKKTAIKQVLKYMPKAVELQKAIQMDSAAITINPSTMSLDTAQIVQITDERDSDQAEELPVRNAIEADPQPQPIIEVDEPYSSEPEPILDYANEAECQEFRKRIYDCHEQLRAKTTGFKSDEAVKKMVIKHLGTETVSACSNLEKLSKYSNELAMMLGLVV